ncbi:serine/threonine-protein phosphatase 6 regulatory ankyrin repeat subunit B isoform X1 [Patella vulgata]|uniref:serine/threonine-protein phosphatase 6 regulatory ankyrin repeat subunit B isoform X1 n=1 Tax=Patella vulgata TaxID=6465 RepID=UPI002180051C|nr:serine/threonine-protein phosphatase 6 regulatory ankyrin repeat subunit B isoform X1 [Patella vulgata]XP_050415303.1 serine/threonine-protein phosphatase 6 regulatory ankyrin repeat subunit B isoform X1 [Patella vulgata]
MMASKGEELHMAIRENNSKKVEYSLSQGVDINVLFYGWTPLQLAIKLGFEEIAVLLIENGCDFKFHDNKSLSPFEMALKKNQVMQVVEKLLLKGIDGCQLLSTSEPPLIYAVKKGTSLMVQTLINANVEVNCCSSEGESPLHLACKEASSDIVNTLISAGADKDAVCLSSGLSPLMVACINENKEAMKVLITNGCDINAQDKDGWTALWYAYSNRNENLLRLLLKSGADKSVVTNEQKSVLEEAIQNDEEEMIELLQKFY